ncbi:hypothetical protein F4804DRAFT_133807 [Jackrogersella minutella]|nr:hypothetical protein F4804DRAFT_133807 [Jackrogersella minutella]
MNLVSLPVEILHRILFFAALSRGVTRARRLKLVCLSYTRYFYSCLQLSLFETRLLDGYGHYLGKGKRYAIQDWRIRNLPGAHIFWHAYLSYGVRNETDPKVGRHVDIRRVIESVCRRTGAEDDDTLEALCWLGLEHVHISRQT